MSHNPDTSSHGTNTLSVVKLLAPAAVAALLGAAPGITALTSQRHAVTPSEMRSYVQEAAPYRHAQRDIEHRITRLEKTSEDTSADFRQIYQSVIKLVVQMEMLTAEVSGLRKELKVDDGGTE